MRPKVAVVGSSNTDLVAFVERLPEQGETLIGHRFLQTPGGKGANQAVAAARLGAEVTFIARVGSDAFGRAACENFRREGILTDYIVQDSEAPSGVALIFVGARGENMIVVVPGANARLSPADVERAEEALRSAHVLLLQLETPLETVARALEIAAESGVTVLLNPAPACHLPPSLLSKVDWLTPNETEASALTGIPVMDWDFARRAGEALLEQGVKHVVVTIGERGALWVHPQGYEHIPGFLVQAVDTTAAGDAFSGALAVALAERQEPKAAIRFANAVAALSVTRPGAQASLPSREEVAQFLRNFSP